MNKKLSLTILVSDYPAFYQQGASLVAGFNKLNYKPNLVIVKKTKKEEAYKQCKGDLIISIGSWRDWPYLYREPAKLGKRVFPWLVSDDKVLKYIREINQAPTLFVTSKFCQHTFEEAGVKKEIIQIIPEGIDTNFWQPVPKKEIETLKAILSLPEKDNRIILLTIGGDGTSKGAQEVLQALKKMPSLNILYFIKVIGGEDAFFEGLKEKRLIKNSIIRKKVRYIMGYFSNDFIRALINLCDIYVAPSRHEGFGLPHVEAMACQKPVITCQGTAAEETSLNKITGYVVPSHPFKWKNAGGYTVDGARADIPKLKEAIKNLVENHKLREKMSRNAKKHIVENYESKKIAQLFLEKIRT